MGKRLAANVSGGWSGQPGHSKFERKWPGRGSDACNLRALWPSHFTRAVTGRDRAKANNDKGFRPVRQKDSVFHAAINPVQ